MGENKCPKCGAGLRSRNTVFRYYLCGSYEGESLHQSAVCKGKTEGRNKLDMTKSTCCGAELDETRVIPDGPHKGHGPCYCSQCGKVAYIV